MTTTLITGGTVVSATGRGGADVLIDGETIVAVLAPGSTLLGHDLSASVDTVIDATGKYVIPGGIDAHTHMELPFGGTAAIDTFETGTIAAAWGGTTSIIDFAVQTTGQKVFDGLAAWHEKASGNCAIDYGFHQIVGGVDDDSLAALPKLGIPAAETRVFLGLDPIGAMARFGQLPLPIEQALAETVALAREARTATPLARTVRVDAALYHEAGATDAFELALLGATLIAYLRTFEAAGVAPADALAQISFVVAADTNQFQTLAKLRAARRIIWRIADAAGAGDAAANLHISARASMRVLAKRDPWTNMLRSTLCCAGAALGGANAITVLPFTAALGAPDDFARRAARNIQIVLQEESWLGRVVDPMGGSWYIENLTDEVAKVAWGFLQDIEAMGGVIAALDQGFVQDKTTADAGLRAKAIATGREDLTGVSAFPLLGDDGVKVAPHPPVPPLTGTQAVRPLTPHRLAEPFEALRDAADAFIAKTGNEPVVFLASLGAVIDHTARSTWIKNYLAAGGIKALTSDGYATPEDAAEAFKASGASLACICSSDALNEIHAAATATQLKQKGAGAVLMAGRPGEREAALREAGVDQFLFAGADAVATLKGLQERLGIS